MAIDNKVAAIPCTAARFNKSLPKTSSVLTNEKSDSITLHNLSISIAEIQWQGSCHRKISMQFKQSRREERNTEQMN